MDNTTRTASTAAAHINHRAKARQEASMGFAILSSTFFGAFSRYRLDECRTRFGEISFLVADAERIDEVTGLPDIIRQEPTREAAMAGLL